MLKASDAETIIFVFASSNFFPFIDSMIHKRCSFTLVWTTRFGALTSPTVGCPEPNVTAQDKKFTH